MSPKTKCLFFIIILLSHNAVLSEGLKFLDDTIYRETDDSKLPVEDIIIKKG
jgi:hypothetical protein